MFNIKYFIVRIVPLFFFLILSACTTPSKQYDSINIFEVSRKVIKTGDDQAGNQEFIHLLHQSRTWIPYDQLTEDPIEVGKNAKNPAYHEDVKILDHSKEDAARSLALKIWMIEHARYTVDVVYYIFSFDLAGKAILGALCNAVKRGVDVRIMVDSIGSMSPYHNDLLALTTCANEAGYMQTEQGQKTPYKARIQAVLFNAITQNIDWVNRRSHDKMLVVDGVFPEQAMVMTGGRNISLSYHGIQANGADNHNTYRDLEVLLKPGRDHSLQASTVGDTSTMYYSLLFLHKGNHLLNPIYQPDEGDIVTFDPYKIGRIDAQKSLIQLKQLPIIKHYTDDMSAYLNTGFHDSKVMLAHELDNLTNDNVVADALENHESNKNSIHTLFNRFINDGTLRIVSPYLFIPRYRDSEGKVYQDGIKNIHQWLEKHPNNRLEIMTNSVLTSDNFMAQSVIDMDLAPRLLLPPEIRKQWLGDLKKGELNPDLVNSSEWQTLIHHPRIEIYELGKLDAASLGNGSTHYGKLHAKFIMGDKASFVGTSNLDYRSRLYNNEMGFFIEESMIQKDLKSAFESLKKLSYRWGTPEWLQMRKEIIEQGGIKGWTTKHQRSIYNFLIKTGLIWYI